MNLDSKQVVSFIKGNVVISICVVVIFAALIGLPIVAEGFEEDVKKAVDAREKAYKNLEKITKSTIAIPNATPERAIVNEPIIARIREVADAKQEQSVGVLEAAKEANRGTHVNFDDQLFPGVDLPDYELAIKVPRFQK